MSHDVYSLGSIPVISALIGWVTNYVAVKMIFRPRKPIRFLGLRIWGLVPRRQAELALSIGDTVDRDLISHRDVQQVLQSDDIQADIVRVLDGQIDKFIDSIIARNPMFGIVLQGQIRQQVRELLLAQMKLTVPSLIDELMLKIEQRLDFKEVIRKKVETLDLSKLEEIIYRISSTELRTIELLGGVLGFIVGLGQVGILWIMG